MLDCELSKAYQIYLWQMHLYLGGGGGGGGGERERERVVADKFHAAAFQKIKKKTTYHLLEY